MGEMKISDVAELNKVIARVKKTSDLAIRIQRLDEGRMKWGVMFDASWGNARQGKTQGGHLLIVYDQVLLEGKRAHVISYIGKAVSCRVPLALHLQLRRRAWLVELATYCGWSSCMPRW